MSPSAPPGKGLIDIRKYSNRRYYDTSRSRHLTLEAIRGLIKDGYDVRVTDNRTQADITSKVLAQIILDLDAPKFDLFPAAFLTELIRVNDQLLLGFYEKFFSQGLRAFLDYQRLVETQLKQGAVLPAMFPPLNVWNPGLLRPTAPESPASPAPTNPPAATPDAGLAATLADLQRQVASLQAQIEKPSGPGRRPGAKRRR